MERVCTGLLTIGMQPHGPGGWYKNGRLGQELAVAELATGIWQSAPGLGTDWRRMVIPQYMHKLWCLSPFAPAPRGPCHAPPMSPLHPSAEPCETYPSTPAVQAFNSPVAVVLAAGAAALPGLIKMASVS